MHLLQMYFFDAYAAFPGCDDPFNKQPEYSYILFPVTTLSILMISE